MLALVLSDTTFLLTAAALLMHHSQLAASGAARLHSASSSGFSTPTAYAQSDYFGTVPETPVTRTGVLKPSGSVASMTYGPMPSIAASEEVWQADRFNLSPTAVAAPETGSVKLGELNPVP